MNPLAFLIAFAAIVGLGWPLTAYVDDQASRIERVIMSAIFGIAGWIGVGVVLTVTIAIAKTLLWVLR